MESSLSQSLWEAMPARRIASFILEDAMPDSALDLRRIGERCQERR